MKTYVLAFLAAAAFIVLAFLFLSQTGFGTLGRMSAPPRPHVSR